MTEIFLPPVAQAVLPDAMGSDTGGESFPRSVGHFAGRTLLPARPARVATLSTGQLDQALSLGLVPAASTHNNSGELIPPYVAELVAGAPVVDLGLRTDPDLDALAAVAPDLVVVTRRGKAFRHLDRYRAIAPTLVTEGKGFNWKQDYLLLASALGQDAAARSVLAEYDGRCADLRGRLAAAGVREVSLVRFGPTGAETFGTWSFAGSILTDLALSRPPTQAGATNGQPVDLLTDPTPGAAGLDGQYLLYAVAAVPVAAATAQRVLAGPAWAGLASVTARRALAVDHSAWFGHAGPLAATRVLDQVEGLLDTARQDTAERR